MSRAALYSILRDVAGEPLLIRDEGHDRPTVTNTADAIVAHLRAQGRLPEGRRLFYQDSGGAVDEILISDGKFCGFAPGREVGAALARAKGQVDILRMRVTGEIRIQRKQVARSLRALAREAADQATRVDLFDAAIVPDRLNQLLQAVTVASIRAWALGELLDGKYHEAPPAAGVES